MNIYLIITIIFVIVLLIGMPLARRVVSNALEDPLLQGDFAAFDRRIGKWYTKIFIPPYNRDYLTLNRDLMEGDRDTIDAMFEHFDHVNLNKKQKQDVYLRGLEYYVSRENAALADKYYELVKGLGDEDLTQYADRLYDIYFKKGWKYLDEMLEEVSSGSLADDAQKRLETYSMISAMYQNKGDEKKSKQYVKKIEDECKTIVKNG